MMPNSETRFAAVVLCGGHSTRMGSPKMLLPFGDEVLLQRIVRIAGDVCSPVAVVKAESQQLPALPGSTIVVSDQHPNMGPLAGLYAGLAALEGKAAVVFATSCDAPLLKPEFMRFMLEQLGDADMVICKDGKYHHPLAAVYRPSLAKTIGRLIDEQRLRPIFLLEECQANVIDVETVRTVDAELVSLRNMNTPDDYKAILDMVKGEVVARPKSDVRMRGFLSRSSVTEAMAWLDSAIAALPAENVSLGEAAGRVLADAVTSPLNVPAFDRSAMDGYAVHADRTTGASDFNPLEFSLIGQSMPGTPFVGDVKPGEAVRIMTGAPFPSGADCVVPAEYARTDDNAQTDTVCVTQAFPSEKNVGRIGEDVKAGDEILSPGRRLRPQDVGLMASVGVASANVIRKPRVRVLVTGNELVEAGNVRSDNQIFDSNTPMLQALIARDGGVIESVVRLTDDRNDIRNAMTGGDVDVVLVSGGSSVGTEDHAPTVLAEVGNLAIHGIAMRPSSPAGLGEIISKDKKRIVFLLPGNPVSCLCAYDFFAGKAIRALGGRCVEWPYPVRQLPLARKISSAVGRMDYCRVTVNDGQVEPLALTGASRLSSTVRGDGFVVVPASLEGYGSETVVDVHFYDISPGAIAGKS